MRRGMRVTPPYDFAQSRSLSNRRWAFFSNLLVHHFHWRTVKGRKHQILVTEFTQDSFAIFYPLTGRLQEMAALRAPKMSLLRQRIFPWVIRAHFDVHTFLPLAWQSLFFLYTQSLYQRSQRSHSEISCDFIRILRNGLRWLNIEIHKRISDQEK